MEYVADRLCRTPFAFTNSEYDRLRSAILEDTQSSRAPFTWLYTHIQAHLEAYAFKAKDTLLSTIAELARTKQPAAALEECYRQMPFAQRVRLEQEDPQRLIISFNDQWVPWKDPVRDVYGALLRIAVPKGCRMLCKGSLPLEVIWRQLFAKLPKASMAEALPGFQAPADDRTQENQRELAMCLERAQRSAHFEIELAQFIRDRYPALFQKLTDGYAPVQAVTSSRSRRMSWVFITEGLMAGWWLGTRLVFYTNRQQLLQEGMLMGLVHGSHLHLLDAEHLLQYNHIRSLLHAVFMLLYGQTEIWAPNTRSLQWMRQGDLGLFYFGLITLHFVSVLLMRQCYHRGRLMVPAELGILLVAAHSKYISIETDELQRFSAILLAAQLRSIEGSGFAPPPPHSSNYLLVNLYALGALAGRAISTISAYLPASDPPPFSATHGVLSTIEVDPAHRGVMQVLGEMNYFQLLKLAIRAHWESPLREKLVRLLRAWDSGAYERELAVFVRGRNQILDQQRVNNSHFQVVKVETCVRITQQLEPVRRHIFHEMPYALEEGNGYDPIPHAPVCCVVAWHADASTLRDLSAPFFMVTKRNLEAMREERDIHITDYANKMLRRLGPLLEAGIARGCHTLTVPEAWGNISQFNSQVDPLTWEVVSHLGPLERMAMRAALAEKRPFFKPSLLQAPMQAINYLLPAFLLEANPPALAKLIASAPIPAQSDHDAALLMSAYAWGILNFQSPAVRALMDAMQTRIQGAAGHDLWLHRIAPAYAIRSMSALSMDPKVWHWAISVQQPPTPQATAMGWIQNLTHLSDSIWVSAFNPLELQELPRTIEALMTKPHWLWAFMQDAQYQRLHSAIYRAQGAFGRTRLEVLHWLVAGYTPRAIPTDALALADSGEEGLLKIAELDEPTHDLFALQLMHSVAKLALLDFAAQLDKEQAKNMRMRNAELNALRAWLRMGKDCLGLDATAILDIVSCVFEQMHLGGAFEVLDTKCTRAAYTQMGLDNRFVWEEPSNVEGVPFQHAIFMALGWSLSVEHMLKTFRQTLLFLVNEIYL